MKPCARIFSPLLAMALMTTANGGVVTQAPTPSFLQVRAVPHGTLKSHAYKSKSLGTDRKLMVYTPPDTRIPRAGIPSFICSTGQAAMNPHGRSVDRRT